MDNDAASPSKENINPFLSGRVTKCGVVGRGEAAVLDSVGQILEVLRTGELDTNKREAEQVTNEQTNGPGRERNGSVDSGIFNSIGAPVAPDSVDQGGYVNKVFNDSSEPSDPSKKQVQPSQKYDSESTSSSSEEDEEDPVGSGIMLPRQGVNMQSNLQNCNNVQLGNKVEISGALTVNTVLNVVSPTGEANAITPGAPKESLPPQSLLKQKPPWLLGVGALVLVVLAVFIVTMAIVLPRKSAEDDGLSRPPIILSDDESDNTTLPGDHHIFSKKQWGGYPARYERALVHPTPFVVISHTADDPCYSVVECVTLMRKFQDIHMSQGFPDIGYNFVVGNDGNVYEGRGWDTTNMHTGFVQRCNVGISLNGNFVHDYPTKAQLNATLALLDLGVQLGKIAEDYKLVAMNQTYATLSPGPILYAIIKEWPHHWVETDDDIAEEKDANTLPGEHRILSKRAWGGDPPRARRPLKHPTPFVVISDTVTPECYTTVQCAPRVRNIQAYHLGDLQLDDVGYNFLVGGDGNIYEGRGWNTTSMHTGFVRYCNIAITLVGSFISSAPTKRQISATIELIKRGVEMGMIAEDYKLIGLKQTSAVSSPGLVLYNMIQTWPHYWVSSRDDPGHCPSS